MVFTVLLNATDRYKNELDLHEGTQLFKKSYSYSKFEMKVHRNKNILSY